MSGLLRTLVIVGVAVLAGALGVQNNKPVQLEFFFWKSRELPVWIFLLAALAIGVVVGGATLLVDYTRVRRQLGKERRRADEAVQRAETAERELEASRARAVAVEPSLREEIEIIEDAEPEPEAEDEDPESTAFSRPGRRGGRIE